MSLGNTSIHQSGEIPEITKLPNGRIRVVRRFVKFNREDVDNVNLGSLMGDFGDLDTTGEQVENQGYANCRLISVEVDTRVNATNNAENPLLVQTYETLTGEFVEITDPSISYTENGLKQITKVFRAISGTTSTNVVGTTTLTGGETLASSQVEDDTAFAELTEIYLESGVIAIQESHRYGDKVMVYSVEGIKLTQAEARAAIAGLPVDAKFYGSRISNYEGLQTTSYEFFTGSGVISTSISYSYSGKLTRTTIVSIDETPVTPVGSVLIDSKAETRDEFILYTYTFVEGQGIVSTNSSSKYDGKLTVTTVTSINEVPTIPVGSTTIEAQVREEDGYLLYITTYASGVGVIGVSTDTKYNGALTLTTTTALNQPPTGIDNLIRSESSQSDYGTIYTYTTATGEGEIGRSTDSKYDGSLIITTVTSLNTVPEGDGALITSSLSQTDYGTIYTYTYAEGEGEIGNSTDEKYNGTLTLTTITSLNTVPEGSGYLFRTNSTQTDYGTIYAYTYAVGEGEIGRSTDTKYNGALTLTTITNLGSPPSGSGYLFRTDTTQTDFGTVYTYTYAVGAGTIGTSTDTKYGGTLTLTTITSLGTVPNGTGYLFRTDTTETDFGTVYTYTYAVGQGQIGISTSEKYNGTLSLTTITNLGVPPTGSGYLFRTDVTETDFGTIYAYSYAVGQGTIGTSSESKYGGTLTLNSITSLGVVPSESGYLFRSDTTQTDFGIIYTYTYAVGEGEIGRSTDTKYNGALTLTTVTNLGNPPTETGYLFRADTTETDFGTIYTYTYAEGEGEIGRATDTKYNGALTLTTVTSIGTPPTETGYLFRTDTTQTDFGIIYTYTYAEGTGEIGRATDTKYGGTLTLTTVTNIGDPPSEGGYLFRSDTTQTDFGTIYTYTYAVGEGEIGRSTDQKYNGLMTLTTVTSLGVVPVEDGYLLRSNTTSGDFGTIYTYTYAIGEGEIARSETSRYQDKLKVLSVTYLNETSPSPPAGYTLIKSENTNSDFGIILTETYAEGIGEISKSTQTRSDGSVVTSYTILGETEPTPPANSYLIEKAYDAADGYDIYTYFYYTIPTDYSVPVSTTWRRPSTLGFDRAQGFFIQTAGSIDPATGTANVTFGLSQPAPVSLTDIDVTTTSYESVSYEDGTRLVRTSTFQNTVGGAGSTLNGGSYLGAEITSGATSSGSEPMPSGNITIGWESVPYFYANGTTVYKTTHTTINV